VLPASITVPNRATVIDLWLPLRVKDPTVNRGSHQYVVLGRLKPGATPAAAATEMAGIAARLAQQYPQAQEKRSVLIRPYLEWVVGNVGLQLFVLLGAAGLVLLIACANAASLLLARASARRREVAVVAALGASRWRIAQQFLVESLILAIGGAIVGLGLAMVATRAIVAAAGAALPRNTQLDSDWRVVAFVAGAIVLTTVLFGLAPALQSTKANLQDALRESSRGGAGGRQRSIFRAMLVVTQFALSVVLLAGAGLMLKTSAALFGADTGIATADHLLTMRIPFPFGSPTYPTADAALDRFYYPMLERVRHLPGVAHAGTINLLPLQSYGNNGNFRVDGETYATISDQPFAEYRFVSPGYFETMGVKILRGRDVSTSDRNATQAVVLVNKALADLYFKGGDPLTHGLVFGQPGPKNPPVPIVGVVSNVRQATLQSSPLPELYFPMGQATGSLANMTLAVGASGDPEPLRQAVEHVIHEVDPTQPVFGVATMADVMRTSVADKRLYLGLLEAFAAMALLLAMAGIYGVISYGVTQRTREFGIRLALGSDTARVQRLVVWQGVRLALIGLVIGVPAAYLGTSLLRSVLYGVQPGDPATLASVAGILAVVGVVASYIPARRVARVDPMVAMRAE
jgi:predicted permease